MSDTDFNKTLHNLADEWAKQAEKADQEGRQLSIGNIQQAFYQRGIAEGIRRAHASLVQLLDKSKQSPEEELTEEFVLVNRESVIALLIRTGLKIHELHTHPDNSYSLILPPLQALIYEDALEQLATSPNLVILAHGRLPNTNKAYIDFAFRKPSS